MTAKDINDVLCMLMSEDIPFWPVVTSRLCDVLTCLQSDSERQNINVENFTYVAKLFHKAVLELESEFSNELVCAIVHCCRVMRNACYNNKEIQDYLCDTCINDTVKILQLISVNKEYCNEGISCTQVAIQFLGNALVDNKRNQIIIWQLCFPMLMQYLAHSFFPIANSAAMVIYNILLGNPEINLREHSDDICLLLSCKEKGSEFAGYALELLLRRENTLHCFYPVLCEHKEEVQLLDIIWSLLLNGKDKSEVHIPIASIMYLVDRFKQQADLIFCLLETKDDPKPVEILRLLDVITCASDSQPYLEELQKDTSLLISTACLLRNITDIGKEHKNIFTPQGRLSDLHTNKEHVETNPVFGFKSCIIRLIGNLCYKNSENQNQVREAGCLPAVLDNCNIDAYNPLLLQWSILAVRNLMENNLENQQVVANLITKGPAPSAVLTELGITLHQSSEGKLCVAPLKRNN